MKKAIVAAIMFVAARSAAADPMVLRQSANTYALVGEGTVVTKDCTVTAEGTLTAKVSKAKGHTFLTFIDRDGEEEAQCEVLVSMSRPRKVDPMPVLVAVRR